MTEPDQPTPAANPPAASPAPATRPAAAAPDLAPGWERSTVEKLLFATLEEQKAQRRWRTFVRLAWLAFFIFIIWSLSYRGSTTTDKSTPHTAVIQIEGEIGPKSEASAESIIAAAKAAFEDQGAQGV